MGKKLFVGNLPFSADDTSLEQMFAQAGTVESAKVITDKMSGRSKGFGFVEMSNDEEAANAITKLNGTDLMGRAVNISEARPMEPRENRGFGGGNSRGFGGGNGGGRREFGNDRGGYGSRNRY